MIYNSDRNFLFVHVQKTAGTTISKALMELPHSEFIAPAHLLLSDVRFNGEQPFIFSVVRNPWARMVSWYEMMLRKGGHNDFSRYLMSDDESASGNSVSFSSYVRKCKVIHESHFNELGRAGMSSDRRLTWNPNLYRKSLSFNQIDYLTDRNGKICCNFFLRFEDLRVDWAQLLLRLNITDGIRLTRENANPRPVDYRRYYSCPTDIDWIAEVYRRDIDYFKFSFDDIECSK